MELIRTWLKWYQKILSHTFNLSFWVQHSISLSFLPQVNFDASSRCLNSAACSSFLPVTNSFFSEKATYHHSFTVSQYWDEAFYIFQHSFTEIHEHAQFMQSPQEQTLHRHVNVPFHQESHQDIDLNVKKRNQESNQQSILTISKHSSDGETCIAETCDTNEPTENSIQLKLLTFNLWNTNVVKGGYREYVSRIKQFAKVCKQMLMFSGRAAENRAVLWRGHCRCAPLQYSLVSPSLNTALPAKNRWSHDSHVWIMWQCSLDVDKHLWRWVVRCHRYMYTSVLFTLTGRYFALDNKRAVPVPRPCGRPCALEWRWVIVLSTRQCPRSQQRRLARSVSQHAAQKQMVRCAKVNWICVDTRTHSVEHIHSPDAYFFTVMSRQRSRCSGIAGSPLSGWTRRQTWTQSNGTFSENTETLPVYLSTGTDRHVSSSQQSRRGFSVFLQISHPEPQLHTSVQVNHTFCARFVLTQTFIPLVSFFKFSSFSETGATYPIATKEYCFTLKWMYHVLVR